MFFSHSLLKRFLNELADPMIIILIVAAAISGVTAFYEGESFTDVIIILAVVIINAVLGVVQESKAEAAIEALQEIAAATSKVLRDGKQVTLKSEELVPGDIVILEAGEGRVQCILNLIPIPALIHAAPSLQAACAAFRARDLISLRRSAAICPARPPPPASSCPDNSTAV